MQRLDQSPEGKIDLHLHPSKDTFLAYFCFFARGKKYDKGGYCGWCNFARPAISRQTAFELKFD